MPSQTFFEIKYEMTLKQKGDRWKEYTYRESMSLHAQKTQYVTLLCKYEIESCNGGVTA